MLPYHSGGSLLLVISCRLIKAGQCPWRGVCQQTALRLSSSCRFFKPNTDLTICQTCQHTTDLSSLTVGFDILVYLDQYSNVLAQTLHMWCFACEIWWLWFFCQPVHCACVKMTSHVDSVSVSHWVWQHLDYQTLHQLTILNAVRYSVSTLT